MYKLTFIMNFWFFFFTELLIHYTIYSTWTLLLLPRLLLIVIIVLQIYLPNSVFTMLLWYIFKFLLIENTSICVVLFTDWFTTGFTMCNPNSKHNIKLIFCRWTKVNNGRNGYRPIIFCALEWIPYKYYNIVQTFTGSRRLYRCYSCLWRPIVYCT